MSNRKRHLWWAAAGIALLAISGCNLFGTSADVTDESPASGVGAVDNKTGPPEPDAKDTPKPEDDKPEAKPEPKIEEKRDTKADRKKETFVPIDISSAFNASATSSEEGLDGWGNAYPADKLPSGKVSFNSTPVRFALPKYAKLDKNIATADGQEIKIRAGKYRALYVLAAATNGVQEAKLVLAAGKEKTRATLKVSDWCDKPAAGEIQAASFARISGENETAQCKLYIQRIALDPSDKLSGITLPINKDIHIFAMTLAK